MSYIVNWSSTGSPGGKPAITVAERTFDAASTSLVLTGKGLNNYGLFQQENFLKLLENFAHSTSPTTPTTGQLWYNTTEGCLKIWNGTEWKNVCADAAFGLGDYSPDPDPNTIGFASRINRIIGTPVGTAGPGESFSNVWGWGQTDWVPTFSSDAALDATSIAREADLPGGLLFPTSFDNNAWAIAISRLRKALRQVGLDEAETSTVGFINDGLPGGVGNSLANLYNDLSGDGSIANITAGYGGLGTAALQLAYTNTDAALTELETYRFSLGSTQTTFTDTSGPVRDTALGYDLNIPTSGGQYVHSVEVDFDSEAAARAFFNAGGQIQFEPSFVPTDGSPSNVEEDWEAFLTAFSGFCFDYKGVKTSSAYATPVFTPTYLPVIDGGSSYIGFYDLTEVDETIFQRDVLDTPGNLFVYTAPTNGGIVITARREDLGGTYRVTFNIEYLLLNVTGGDPGQNDITDTQLDGVLSSDIGIFRASTANCDVPGIALPSVTHSGTFTQMPS